MKSPRAAARLEPKVQGKAAMPGSLSSPGTWGPAWAAGGTQPLAQAGRLPSRGPSLVHSPAPTCGTGTGTNKTPTSEDSFILLIGSLPAQFMMEHKISKSEFMRCSVTRGQ